MDKKKTLVNLIKMDLNKYFREFIEQASARRAVANRALELARSDKFDLLQMIKRDLAHQIGEYMVENDYLQETKYDDPCTCHTIIDSTMYVVKPKNLEKFLEAIALYIVNRWLNDVP